MYALPFLLLSRIQHAAIEARRKDRTWKYLMWSAIAGACAALMMMVGMLFASMLFAYGLWYLAIFVVAVMVLPAIAQQLARHVVIRFGWARLAYWMGPVCKPGTDSPALSMVMSAWAIARLPSRDNEAWLIKLRDARRPLGDAEVVVTGLLAAARGDHATARQLLRSAKLLVENHPQVREIAYEWLCVDAAARGAWDEIEAEGWPATPLAYLLEGIARAVPRRELLVRWILAPHRRATWALMQQRLQYPDFRGRGLHGSDKMTLAVTMLADPWPEQFADTITALDEALADDGLRTWLARRALELDAPVGAVDRALRSFASTAADQLTELAEAHMIGAPSAKGLVGELVARQLRHGRLDNLEQAFTRWSNRRHEGQVRLPIDEWREFIALREAYTRAITAGGLELRRLAFPHAHSQGNSMAVWLWNSRNEYPLSYAISRWLLDEALIVGDSEAIDTGTKNCRLSVPTRLGPFKS